MKKWTTLFTLLITLSTFAGAQSLSNLSFGSDESLDIICWNLEWFPQNGDQTVDSLVVAIEALEADIIAIQEIDDATKLTELASALGDWEYYVNDSEYLELAYLYNTNTIAMDSIYEIYTGDYFRQFPREPLVIEFSFENEDYIMINNHLKCCGDGYLNSASLWDEETRRKDAMVLLRQYVNQNFADDKVLIVGDFNDDIAENNSNVFTSMINDSLNFRFVDMEVAESIQSEWSYPSWPSHLDHFAITNELFAGFDEGTSFYETLFIEDEVNNGLNGYYNLFSDHRAVAVSILPESPATSIRRLESNEIDVSVYPNPTRDLLFIETDQLSDVDIYSLDGKLILRSEQKSKHSISKPENVSMAIVKIQTELGIVTKKVSFIP